MLHRKIDPNWSSVVEQWQETQNRLRLQLLVAPLNPLPHFVAGADAAFSEDKQTVFAAAVVYDRQRQCILEVAHAARQVEFPYIPDFLSFREGPALLEAIAKLQHEYGVILFDGQGYAHPRRCGIASHLAILLNRPGVGVAKSRLIGTYNPPGQQAGSSTPLLDGDEQIGLVMRTRSNVNPLFVSIAHRVDLKSAEQLVLACCAGYRVPEPTRQADIEVAQLKRAMVTGF